MTNNKQLKKNSEQDGQSFINIFLKILITGVGLGVITGSLLKILSSNSIREKSINLFSLSKDKSINKKNISSSSKQSIIRKKNLIFPYTLKRKNEIVSLSAKWNNLLAAKSDLEASAFLLLVDEGKYAELLPMKKLPAASSIKVAILLVTLEMLDKGILRWDEELKLTKDVIGGGAGWIAYQEIGKSFPIYEIATEMIRISDNTATNLLIKRLGGMLFINKKLEEHGLSSIKIYNLLPDLEGTNTASAKDLAYIFALIDSGNILSRKSRDLFREILSTSTSNRLLPGGLLYGLGGGTKNPDYNLLLKGYKVYNKTGDIGISYADTGLIQLPDNSRAVAGFIVKGPFNDPRSSQLIRDMASEMAEYLKP